MRPAREFARCARNLPARLPAFAARNDSNCRFNLFRARRATFVDTMSRRERRGIRSAADEPATLQLRLVRGGRGPALPARRRALGRPCRRARAMAATAATRALGKRKHDYAQARRQPTTGALRYWRGERRPQGGKAPRLLGVGAGYHCAPPARHPNRATVFQARGSPASRCATAWRRPPLPRLLDSAFACLTLTSLSRRHLQGEPSG